MDPSAPPGAYGNTYQQQAGQPAPAPPAPGFAAGPPPSQYPQPGQYGAAVPTEPPPKYEPPKDGPYAPPPTTQPVPPVYQQPGATIVAQPVHQTILVAHGGYGPLPKVMQCPYCQAQITTSVNYVTGGLTWLAAGLLCLFGCWAGCCLIPFCVPDMQDVQHSCPHCKGHIATHSRL